MKDNFRLTIAKGNTSWLDNQGIAKKKTDLIEYLHNPSGIYNK
jgi:hypothetical protein